MPFPAGLLGVGGYLPHRVVTNSALTDRLGVDEKWIVSRTGVHQRRYADADEDVLTMGVRAAAAALEAAQVSADSIDTVILATSTYLNQTPSGAAQIAAELKCRTGPAACDLSAGCSGYTHGISVATSLVNSGSAEHVLVVGSEKLSPVLDYDDRSTAPIFGDGAGAAVIGPTSTPSTGIGHTVWGSQGDLCGLIRQEPTWSAINEGSSEGPIFLRMEGTNVFRWVAQHLPTIVKEIAARNGHDLDEIEVFIPHQANIRIVEAITRSVPLNTTTVVADHVRTVGNTSAAAIPLAITELIESGRARPGQLALQVSFGAGLSYAGQTVTMPPALSYAS